MNPLKTARTILRQYDLPVTSLELIDQRWNTIVRVESGDGRGFALRIQRPGHRTAIDIVSELWWLSRLAEETDLGTPEPIPNRSGNLLTTGAESDEAGTRRAVLFSWVPGQPVERPPTLHLAYQLGTVLATLHRHADTLIPPAEFSTTRMDQVWAFGRSPEIFGDEPDALFTLDRRAVLRESGARVERALAALYADPADLRFIHADLHLGNVKVDGNRLRPLDFDDCLWGYPIQDICISLASLQRAASLAGLTETRLIEAFKQGYGNIRSWPAEDDGQIETFLAARMLLAINYMLHPERPDLREGLSERLAWYEPRLRAWLSGGSLIGD